MKRRVPSKIVTVFGSSLPGADSDVYAQAQQLGQRLAEAGFVVCNGGYGGLMEASARGAREAGGSTLGVTCALWPSKPNPWIVEEIRTASYPERIMTLIERGDAYITLPGGTGTLAELALAWEMMNKANLSRTVGGRKPLLVMSPYWQPVLECLTQEANLGAPAGVPFDRTARAMEVVTLVTGADEVVEKLVQLFATPRTLG